MALRKFHYDASRCSLEEMDDTDRKLLILIGQNPRIHFREIAKGLGISRQAVHNRLRALIKLGVIKGWMAGVSVSYLDAIPVAVSGTCRAASVDRTLDRLGESEFTRRVIVAGGNYLYIVGILRNISELDGYVHFVKHTAELGEPMIGIYSLDVEEFMPYSVDGSGRRKESYKRLSPLDLRIIASLRDNARRPVAEIADAIGVSSKTVRRHLEGMISDGSLEMNVPMDLTSAGDMLAIMHVNLRNGADKREVGRRLFSRHYFSDQYIRTHINLPSFLAWVFWSDDINQIRKALRETGDDEDVQSVTLNFAYYERLYNTTWRDKLADVQYRPPKRQNAHIANPRRGAQ